MKDMIVTDYAPAISPYSQAVRAHGFPFASQIALGRITCALVFFSCAQLSQPKPLTKADVLSLVAAWPVAESAQHLIQQRGISFSPTEEYSQMLDRASGGTSASLEETLRRAKVRPLTEAEAPNESALLQHLTRCGELNNSQSPIPHSSEAEAEVECRAALSLDPRNPYVLLAVGSSLSRQQQKAKEAVAVYKQALALDPGLVLGHVLLAMCISDGSREEGLVEGIEALRLDPNSREAMFFFAIGFGDVGVSDRDIATLRAEAQGHVNDPVPHFVLGLAYMESSEPSRLQKAMTEFREAIRLDPGIGSYHYFLGGALSDSGDKRAALAELETAIKLAPDNEMFRNTYDQLFREVKK